MPHVFNFSYCVGGEGENSHGIRMWFLSFFPSMPVSFQSSYDRQLTDPSNLLLTSYHFYLASQPKPPSFLLLRSLSLALRQGSRRRKLLLYFFPLPLSLPSPALCACMSRSVAVSAAAEPFLPLLSSFFPLLPLPSGFLRFLPSRNHFGSSLRTMLEQKFCCNSIILAGAVLGAGLRAL